MMFCKYCGKPIQGTHCPSCGKDTALVRRSTDLERLLGFRSPGGSKSYQDGLQEGYINGQKEGYQKGYGEGLSAASGLAGKAPAGQRWSARILAACLAALLAGAAIGGAVFHRLGYQKGEAAGADAGRVAAAEEASRTYQPLMEQEYARGVEDGRVLGYEQGFAEAETALKAAAEEENDQPGEALYSRQVNPGTPKEPSQTVKKIQERLAELGYLRGGADGVFGRQTESAVKAFQKHCGLPETGEVDQRTYDKLLEGMEDPDEPKEAMAPLMIVTTRTDLPV